MQIGTEDRLFCGALVQPRCMKCHGMSLFSRPLTKKTLPIAKSIAYNKHIWYSLHHNVNRNIIIQHLGRSRNVMLWSSWDRPENSQCQTCFFADLFFSMVMTVY
ncbi:hypothetical protein E4T39_07168 [Aureobasidium subglaciale]|nr:hypothetical protein E4T39_07168 [Aureobasidium subglaciale]